MIRFLCVAAFLVAANGSPPLRRQSCDFGHASATNTVELTCKWEELSCGGHEARPNEGYCATTPALGWIWNSQWTCHEQAICMQIIEAAIFQRNSGFAIKVGQNDLDMIASIMELVSKHRMRLDNPSIVYEAIKTYQWNRIEYALDGAFYGGFAGYALCVARTADKFGYAAVLTCLGSEEREAGMLLGLMGGSVVGEVVGAWHVYLDGDYVMWQLEF